LIYSLPSSKSPEPQEISPSGRNSKGLQLGPWSPSVALILVVSALFDFIFTRFILRAVDFELGILTALQWSRVGNFARNLGAIAAIILLTSLLARGYRARRLAPLPRRLLILFFGAILWCSAVALTLCPQDKIVPRLVFMSLASANVTAVLVCLEGLRWPTTRPVRLGLFAWTLTLFSSFTSLVLALAGASTGWATGLRIAGHLRDTGEIAFLATAPLVAFALLLGNRRARLWVIASVVLFASAIGLFAVLQRPSSEYGVLIYGATRLSIFLDQMPGFYLLLLPLALGSSTALACHPDALRRSVGIALILLLCAGYSPSSPSTLLLMCTGTVMLVFAMVQMSWRSYQSAMATQKNGPESPASPPTDAAPASTELAASASEAPRSPASEEPANDSD